MRRWWIGVLLVLAILGAGGAGVALILTSAGGRGAAQAVDTTDDAEKVPNVKVKTLRSVTLEDALNLTGRVEPWDDVTLSVELGGRIAHQAIEEGDRVSAGQLLFALDIQTLEARLRELEAQVQFADQEFDRLRRMVGEGIGSRQDMERAETQRSVAHAGLENLKIQRAKSQIKAPFAGVVDKIYKQRDEFVDMGAPLVRLVQVDKVKVVVGIPERDVVRFAPDDPAEVSLDALEGRAFSGSLHRIAPTAEVSTRTFSTEIAVDNEEGILRPGMIARVRLVRESYPDAVAVPVFSVITLDDSRHVFVEDGGVARLRPIEVGVFLGEEVQVVNGLGAGDRVIVVGQRDLRDGAPVSVQETLP